MSHISQVPAGVFIERLLCDCGGEMRPTGIVLDSNPPQYPHKCERCDNQEIVHGVQYPRHVHYAAEVKP